MNNLKRLKKLVLANKETRRLYRMMQFLAIFMVISCTIIIVVAKWIEHDQNQKREELFGSWDEVFLDVPAEDLNYFKQNAFLEQISIQSIQAKVFLEGDQRVVLGSCDDNFLEMGNIELLEGRMPEKENEVAVEEEHLEILGVSNVGDVVSKDSEVKTLVGYKIIGIIKNYTQNWRMVNNIKFINCFILGEFGNEFDVFVKYYKSLGAGIQDLEVNMIEYRRNIYKTQINLNKILLKIILFILFLECVLMFLIAAMIRKYYAFRFVKNKEIKLSYVIVVLIEFLCMILLLHNIFQMQFHYFQYESRIYSPLRSISNIKILNYEVNFLLILMQKFDKIIDINWTIIYITLILLFSALNLIKSVRTKRQLIYNKIYYGKNIEINFKDFSIVIIAYILAFFTMLLRIFKTYDFLDMEMFMTAVNDYVIYAAILFAIIIFMLIVISNIIYKKIEKLNE